MFKSTNIKQSKRGRAHTLLSGFTAFVFGALQAVLLKYFLASFTSGSYGRAAALLLVKLLAYGAAIAAVVIFFSDRIISIAAGYAVGLPAAVTLCFIYKAFIGKNADSGDGKNEQSNNN